MTFAYQLTDITFQYSAKTVLSVADLNIIANQTTAIIGPNGSGKSTLLNLLAFLKKPTSGDIAFFDSSSMASNPAGLRKKVGWLAQKPYLLRGTVRSNIELALKLRHKAHAFRAQQISDVMEQLNIAHLAEQPINQLSGGEKQKTALARTLVLAPEVLIMDEPFSFLDQASARMMENFIEDYPKTLIFSTHTRLQGQALADQVIMLINGKPVQTPLMNVFNGSIKQGRFNTGKICIILPEGEHSGRHIAIDPSQIVISRESLRSSMRNFFQGRITMIEESSANVRLGIQAGEVFDVLITYQALQELQLTLGSQVWINFKSNAVDIF